MANTLYTRIIDPNTTSDQAIWNNLTISSTTVARRKELSSRMDDFASFSWRGYDAFQNFGAFIINKSSLKFYNGPTYSNSYTKPQFDSAFGQLTGITFNTQKIDFQIGVYWISEEHYRQLIYWLNPYEINTLSFGFEPNYYYQVKLASVEDGIRYIVGHETLNGRDCPMYYTEMKISFEVQGPACAYCTHLYEISHHSGASSFPEGSEEPLVYQIYKLSSSEQQENKLSDLPFPIEALIRVHLIGNQPAGQDHFNVMMEAQYKDNNPILLFDVDFKNQTYGNSSFSTYHLDIKYESDSGLLLLNVGDSEYMLLNQLSTSEHGKRIIDSIIVNHFEIPGLFDTPAFEPLNGNLKFKVTVQSNATTSSTYYSRWLTPGDVQINLRGRTNLI